jgi:hypothetical protein
MRVVMRWCKINGAKFLCRQYQTRAVADHKGKLGIVTVQCCSESQC